jgi:hypothetical protein
MLHRICIHILSIDTMNDERYVHFKLSDRSMHTILGDILKPYPDSYITQLVFNDAFKSAKDEQGYFWVDEESQIFSGILTFYRHGHLVLPDIFADIRHSIINKYLLPIETSCIPRSQSITTASTTYVRLRGETSKFSSPNSIKLDTYQCTVVDPFWNDLLESKDSDFEVSEADEEGIEYVLKSFLTVMNWLVLHGYEIEHWDEKKQEANLKKVHTRTTS